MNAIFLKDLTVRAPTMDDAQAITDLINAADIVLTGEKDFELDSLLTEWGTPNFNMATDAWVVTASDGTIVGYEILYDTADDGRIWTDGYVHPNYFGQGIGTQLLRLAEARAHERFPEFSAQVPITMETTVYSHDTGARQMLEAEGYATVRHFWRMVIEMTDAPATPVLPEGITIRTFVPNQDEQATYSMVQKAFEDHWGHAAIPYEDWLHSHFNRENFDPTLYFLAVKADDTRSIIGAVLCNLRVEDAGWIRSVGVLREGRGKGVAMALLRQAFGEFYRRGRRWVGLGVDSQNPTGATRLYERAGMHITRRYDIYQKVLRPGQPSEA